jgi:hypothetical protein
VAGRWWGFLESVVVIFIIILGICLELGGTACGFG